MSSLFINLNDNGLYGNTAAEDEPLEIFLSYAIRRGETARLVSDDGYCILKALKGYGKSAIMRIAKNELKSSGKVVVDKVGLDLAPKIQSKASDDWVTGWKENIYMAVAEEIGARASKSFDPDASMLREIAKDSGRRQLNFLETLKQYVPGMKFSCKASLAGPEVSVATDLSSVQSKECSAKIVNILDRYLAGRDKIYVFIDDIDHNFVNTEEFKAKVSGLLTACRYIVNATGQLCFRIALRPNTWAIIKRQDPAMSHIRQYIVDIWWNYSDIHQLLFGRIAGYVKRVHHDGSLFNKNKSDVLGLVFDKVDWDQARADANLPLGSFAQRRPRWVLELFKESAKEALATGRHRICLKDIENAANRYGDTVISDVCAEYACECSDVESYIRMFFGQYWSYTRDELIEIIQNRIVEGHPTPKPESRDIAHFLFYCGVLYAREDHSNGRYTQYTYANKPHLLTKNNFEDQKYRWEIDLIYRRPLKMIRRARRAGR